jgi:nitrilase
MTSTGSTTFRAAAVQDCPVWLDRDASIAKACDLIRQAGAGGANIVALPESFVPGFPYWVFVLPLSQTGGFHERLYANAVEVPSAATEALGRACAAAKVTAVVGVTERIPGRPGTMYNTNLVFGPDGSLLGKHRKIMPTWGERVVWTGGDGSTMGVFDTPYGPLGTLCCGENINPLARFALLAQGERIHVANFPSAAMAGARHTKNELYLHVAPHAYEGKLYSIVSSDFGTPEVAAQLGVPFEEGGTSYNCLSGILGPDGEWVGEPLYNERGIVYADCPIEPVIFGKLFHDVIGHYNRFDVLKLHLNTQALEPLDIGR